MSKRNRKYCDDSDSDAGLARSGRASRSAAVRKGGGDFGTKHRKEQSRPWSQEESEWLIQVVSKMSTDLDNINWQDVAKQVPSRTGKQCREKWKNDLRPNICKDAWSLKEEYVLAVAHSLHGNRWSEVAKYLPTRPENTIKNRWYATNRAKAEVKIKTFLWLYSDLVDRQSYPAGPEAIEKARELYHQLPDVVPLEEFEVPVDFYIASLEDGCAAMLDTRPEIKIIGRGKAKPHVPGVTTVGSSGSGSAAVAAVLSAVRGAAAASSASHAACNAVGSAGTVLPSMASVSVAVSAAAAATTTAGSGSKDRSGDSGGGDHSEGDAKCYVQVGRLDDELPTVGNVKHVPRKRKLPVLVKGCNSAPVHSVAKHARTEPSAAEPLSVDAGGAGGGAATTIITRVRVVPKADFQPSLLTMKHTAMGPPSVLSTTAAATAAATAMTTTVMTDTMCGGSGAGDALPSPLDPEALWQTSIEPYNQHSHKNNVNAPSGRRANTSRLGALPSGASTPHHVNSATSTDPSGCHPASNGTYGGHPTTTGSSGGEADTLQSLFNSSSRMLDMEGGSLSVADLGLFQLGPGTMNGLLDDADGVGVSSVTEADTGLLSLGDEYDLASLTALIGLHDVHGEASSDCAQEAIAGLAADVLSQMPDGSPLQRRMPQQCKHTGHQLINTQQGHLKTATKSSGCPPLAANSQSPHLNQQQLQQHHYNKQPLLTAALHHASTSSSGEHQQQQQQQQQRLVQQQVQHQHQLPHPHSMSQGSYPLHPSQPLIQQQQALDITYSPQQPPQPSPQSQHQHQVQQQAMQFSASELSGSQSHMFQRRLPATATPACSGAPSGGPAASTPRTPVHQSMYGSLSYSMSPPHSHPQHPASAPPALPASLLGPPGSAGAGGRAMMPCGSTLSPIVKYGMTSPYAGPLPPGSAYTVSGPPPPYMMAMSAHGGYYKMSSGRLPPGVMLRSMMPYPPPYGMSMYSPHSTSSNYLDSQQSGGMGSGTGTGAAVSHSQQGGNMELCTPAVQSGSMRAVGVMNHGGGGGGASDESLAATASMGMGRPYCELGSTGPMGPGAGQAM